MQGNLGLPKFGGGSQLVFNCHAVGYFSFQCSGIKKSENTQVLQDILENKVVQESLENSVEQEEKEIMEIHCDID